MEDERDLDVVSLALRGAVMDRVALVLFAAESDTVCDLESDTVADAERERWFDGEREMLADRCIDADVDGDRECVSVRCSVCEAERERCAVEDSDNDSVPDVVMLALRTALLDRVALRLSTAESDWVRDRAPVSVADAERDC